MIALDSRNVVDALLSSGVLCGLFILIFHEFISCTIRGLEIFCAYFSEFFPKVVNMYIYKIKTIQHIAIIAPKVLCYDIFESTRP